MRTLDLIVVHCSDSDHAHHDNVETIRGWHVDERGFNDIGYHRVITKDGTAHTGRELETIGAHALGYNLRSVGICLTGKYYFSEKQFKALRIMVNNLKQIYPTITRVIGHCDVSDKTCPNFDYKKVLGL